MGLCIYVHLLKCIYSPTLNDVKVKNKTDLTTDQHAAFSAQGQVKFDVNYKADCELFQPKNVRNCS